MPKRRTSLRSRTRGVGAPKGAKSMYFIPMQHAKPMGKRVRKGLSVAHRRATLPHEGDIMKWISHGSERGLNRRFRF
jgi:hypothetical protein